MKKGRRRKKGKKGGPKREQILIEESDSEEEKGLDMPEGSALADGVGALRMAAAEQEEEEEEEEEQQEFKCELCKKDFQSYAQLSQHLTSKAHRRAEKDKEKEDAKVLARVARERRDAKRLSSSGAATRRGIIDNKMYKRIK